MSWPLQADHAAQAGRLRDQLDASAFTGVVVVTAPNTTTRTRNSEAARSKGSEYVEHVVRIARELPEILGQRPGCTS